jgi:hypothetical protein
MNQIAGRAVVAQGTLIFDRNDSPVLIQTGTSHLEVVLVPGTNFQLSPTADGNGRIEIGISHEVPFRVEAKSGFRGTGHLFFHVNPGTAPDDCVVLHYTVY